MPPHDAAAMLREAEQLRTQVRSKEILDLLDSIEPLVNTGGLDQANYALNAVRQLVAAQAKGGAIGQPIAPPVGGILQTGTRVANDQHVATYQNIFYMAQKAADAIVSPAMSGTPVPILPFVMTATQAKELAERTVFKGRADLRKDYTQLRTMLDQNDPNFEGLLARYGDTPQDWRPFGGAANDISLDALVRQRLQLLNESMSFESPLVPDFKDVGILITQRRQLLKLREQGCVAIMDVISMRHPALLHAFHTSLLDAYPNTSIVTIAPHPNVSRAARGLTIALKVRLEDMELIRRIDDTEGNYYCEEVTQVNELGKFLWMNLQRFGSEASATPLARLNKLQGG